MTTKEERELFMKETEEEMMAWCRKHHTLPNLCFVPRTRFPKAETKVDVDDLLVKLKNKEIEFKQIKILHEDLVLSGADMAYIWIKTQE